METPVQPDRRETERSTIEFPENIRSGQNRVARDGGVCEACNPRLRAGLRDGMDGDRTWGKDHEWIESGAQSIE
jgi:hypothetical protein